MVGQLCRQGSYSFGAVTIHLHDLVCLPRLMSILPCLDESLDDGTIGVIQSLS
jgi:hypothetical protein